ncbi:MAG: hypothetical protein KAG94_01645 [Clostridiales bacterium]|nr:hypothetical protein [Clostridiales bacterium]
MDSKFYTPIIKQPPYKNTFETNRLTSLLSKWANFAVKHYNSWESMPDCGHFFGGVYNYEIETSSTMTVLAVLATIGTYDETTIGVSKEQSITMVSNSIRYLCYTHHTGPSHLKRDISKNPMTSQKKWGYTKDNFFMSSQTGVSVSMIGLSALLLWNELSEQTKVLVAKVLCFYADKYSSMIPGTGVYNDTQCEENAWTSVGISAALYLFPNHPNHEKWKQGYIKWSLNTVVTPKDKLENEWDKVSYKVRNGIVIDENKYGFSSITFHPDYTAENHGYIHPDYIGSGIGLRISSAIFPLILGKKVYESVLYNNKELYDQVIKPWSTINGNSISIEGQDWFYHRHGNKFLIHSTMDLFFKDPIAKLMKLNSLSITEKKQNTNGNGCLIEKDGDSLWVNPGIQSAQDMEYGYVRSIVLGYILHLYMASDSPTISNEDALKKLEGNYDYPYGNISVYRTKDSFSSFSTRGTIMGLSLPKNSELDITPTFQSFTGIISLKSQNNGISEGLMNWNDVAKIANKRQVVYYEKGFSSTVELNRADNTVLQHCSFTALESGSCVYIESLHGIKEKTPPLSIKTGLIGVGNEHIIGLSEAKGYKNIYFNSHKEIFLGNYQGENLTLCEKNINYVNVDNNIGYLLYNSSSVCYQNIHKYHKWKGLEDILTLNKAEHISNKPLFIISLPNQNNDETLLTYLRTIVTCNNLKTPSIRIGNKRILINFTNKKIAITEMFTLKTTSINLFIGTTTLRGNQVTCYNDLPPFSTRKDNSLATVTFSNLSNRMLDFTVYDNNIFIRNTHSEEITYSIVINQKTFTMKHLPNKLLQLKL